MKLNIFIGIFIYQLTVRLVCNYTRTIFKIKILFKNWKTIKQHVSKYIKSNGKSSLYGLSKTYNAFKIKNQSWNIIMYIKQFRIHFFLQSYVTIFFPENIFNKILFPLVKSFLQCYCRIKKFEIWHNWLASAAHF